MVQGGLVLKKEIADVGVSWEWNGQAQGIVQWNFVNNAEVTQSGLLFRNGYPFGNAFWPIYEDNSADFGTSFTSIIVPLANNGVMNNSMPLVVYQNPDGSYFVAFVFTLAPHQSWSCLEGGFTGGMTPSGFKFVPASRLTSGRFRINYDPEQCQGYNQQSGSNLPCPANPVHATSVVMNLNQQVTPMFNDIVLPVTIGNSGKPSCAEMIVVGIASLNASMIIQGLECSFGNIPKEWKAVIRSKF